MLRMVISLDQDDKAWLKKMAKKQRISIAAVIRHAIDLYRLEMERRREPDMNQLLEQTKGIWPQEDGLVYQQKLRDEWEKSDEEDS